MTDRRPLFWNAALGLAAVITAPDVIDLAVIDQALLRRDNAYPLTSTEVIAAKVVGDLLKRIVIYADATIVMGDGTSPVDTALFRSGPGELTINTNLVVPGYLKAHGLTYPQADGSTGQAITTDGAGHLGFSTVAGARKTFGYWAA